MSADGELTICMFLCSDLLIVFSVLFYPIFSSLVLHGHE